MDDIPHRDLILRFRRAYIAGEGLTLSSADVVRLHNATKICDDWYWCEADKQQAAEEDAQQYGPLANLK
jgi:hypothetical protein